MKHITASILIIFGGSAGTTASTNRTSNAQTGKGLGSSASVPSVLVEMLIQSLKQKVAA